MSLKSLGPGVSDLISNCQNWATEEAFQQTTKHADGVKVLTKGLQELT